MKHHPKNGMIDAPRNGDGEHTSEAPKTYARRPAMGFHVILRDCCSVSEQGTVYTEGRPLIVGYRTKSRQFQVGARDASK